MSLLDEAPAQQATRAGPPDPEPRSWHWVGFLPSGLLFGVFLGAPLVLVVLYSFWKVVDYQIVHDWTTDNYHYLLTTGVYLKVALRTLGIAVVATALAVGIAFPFVYWLSRYVRRSWQRPLLVLVILPFGTSYLLRVYAWLAILGDRGLVNQLLQALGLANDPVRLLYNSGAVIVVLVYLYLPFAVLTMFTAIERFDWDLMKAAQDLGARPLQAIFKVLVPQMRTGIITAVIFVFIPILGEYLTPQLVGGTQGAMIGNTVVNFFQSSQYARGAALGIIIMAVVAFLLVPARRYLDVGKIING
jgi:spermidine/putrescine transport system permease protein